MVGLHIPGGPNALRLADARAFVREHMGIEPTRQVLVCNGRLLLGRGSEVVGEPGQEIVVETHQRPAAEETISVRTTFGEEAVDSSFRGDTSVWDLKRFLARRFQLAPCRQVLTTLGVAMEEGDPLGAYAARDPILVALAVSDVDERWLARPVTPLVYSSDGRFASFCVDARDTFDVLLGKLEQVGMVAEGEEVTFVSGTQVYHSWRTFGDYELSRPLLWIHNDE